MFFSHGAACRHGVATKAQQHAGVTFGHQVQSISQMKTRYRAARAFEFVFFAGGLAGCKHKGGAVQFVFQARGHDAHHAFVKVGVKHANGGRGLFMRVQKFFGQLVSLFAHIAFNFAAFAVDGVQLAGQLVGTGGVVGQQAFNAQSHVGQAARSIQARAHGKSKIKGGGHSSFAACHRKQAGQTCRKCARANPLEALRYQSAVVGIELDHIGHGAQSHQRQQGVEFGLLLGGKCASRTQLGAQGQQHIKHHPYTCHGFAGKSATRLVGVDDDFSRGQLGAGQVVVGHQDLQAQSLGGGHAFHAGNAVVYRHQHLGTGGVNPLGDGRGQAVAIHHAVGYHVAHARGTQQAQAAHGHGAGGGAVTVVVGHDANRRLARHGVGQQRGSGLRAQHF